MKLLMETLRQEIEKRRIELKKITRPFDDIITLVIKSSKDVSLWLDKLTILIEFIGMLRDEGVISGLVEKTHKSLFNKLADDKDEDMDAFLKNKNAIIQVIFLKLTERIFNIKNVSGEVKGIWKDYLSLKRDYQPKQQQQSPISSMLPMFKQKRGQQTQQDTDETLASSTGSPAVTTSM